MTFQKGHGYIGGGPKKGKKYSNMKGSVSPTQGFQKGHKFYSGAEKGWFKEVENIGVAGIHKRIRTKYGVACWCEVCGEDDANKIYHWANIDHKYSKNPEDYVQMCMSCHAIYDKLGYKI